MFNLIKISLLSKEETFLIIRRFVKAHLGIKFLCYYFLMSVQKGCGRHFDLGCKQLFFIFYFTIQDFPFSSNIRQTSK